jgi:hypothetical protein
MQLTVRMVWRRAARLALRGQLRGALRPAGAHAALGFVQRLRARRRRAPGLHARPRQAPAAAAAAAAGGPPRQHAAALLAQDARLALGQRLHVADRAGHGRAQLRLDALLPCENTMQRHSAGRCMQELPTHPLHG